MSSITAPTPSRIDRFWQFLEADPGNTALLRDIAREGLGTQQFEEALKALDQLAQLQASEPHDEAAALLALVKLGRAPAACERAEHALARWPDEAAIKVEAARALLNARRFAEALPLCEGAFEDDSLAQMAGEFALQALWNLGELAVASERSAQLTAQFPGNPRILALHSALLYDQERMADAFDAAKRAYAMSPQHAYTALHVLASERLMHEDVDGAMQLVDEAQQINTNDGRIWMLKGSARMMAGQVDEAVADLQRALTLFPNHPGTHLTLAWVHIGKGEWDLAEASIHQAIEASPAFAESHGTLAVVLALKGQREEADHAIRRAKLLDKRGFAAQYAQSVLEGKMLDDLPRIFKALAGRVKL